MLYKQSLFFIIIFLAATKIYSQETLPLIGTYYFDGWSGSNKSKEKWAQNMPTHVTQKLLSEYSEREPLWGWRDDSMKIMEKQINLASDNGIDFFSFCWYWSKDKQDIDEQKIHTNPLHTSINLFMKAQNNTKMKFSLMVANHTGAIIKDKEMWLKAIDFWCKHYFSHPQYLKINNCPVISVFQSKDINEYIPELKHYIKQYYQYEGIYIISNNYNKSDSNFDLMSWYNIREKEPGYSLAKNYIELTTNVKRKWKSTTHTHIAPCIMVNWDKRPWETKKEGIYYINRTPKLFKQQVKDGLNYCYKMNYPHKIIFIYAWNELGEGGYLIPTQGDKKAKYLKMIKQAKKEFIKDLQQHENSIYQH